jgi:sulfite reductase (ferredoxin)
LLRLKQPAGELPADLYRLLDDLSNKMRQGDLRATTRQCFQMHGILKGNLKTVISSIMKVGSSTVGACGDVNRNGMVTPAPFQTKAYICSAYAEDEVAGENVVCSSLKVAPIKVAMLTLVQKGSVGFGDM